MIFNADRMYADHPWAGLAADRTTLLGRAWDEPAARWNQQQVRNFQPVNAERDSAWWIHDEADQTLAALNLRDGFTHKDQLATQRPVLPRCLRRPRPRVSRHGKPSLASSGRGR